MSMLQHFFEIRSDDSLVDGLKIAEHVQLCDEHMGKFPVIALSLKGIDGNTYEEAVQKLSLLISTECKCLAFLEKSENVNLDDVTLFRHFSSQQENEVTAQFSLSVLMCMLHAQYGKCVILLVDEYDVPLDKIQNHGYYDQMVNFLRTFFGEALKTNSDLYFAGLTGCLRISKESIFTGLNNLKTDTIQDECYDEYFGFIVDDVKKLLEDYNPSFTYEDVRE